MQGTVELAVGMKTMNISTNHQDKFLIEMKFMPVNTYTLPSPERVVSR